MKQEMSAAVLYGLKDLRIDRRPVPQLGPHQVLLRVRRAGICGTDVHYFEEGRFGNFAVTAPFILGHEVTGEIAAMSDDVDTLAVGQRVVVNPARHCGHCDYCRRGRNNLCRRVRMLGSASTLPPSDGAFCEFLALGAEQCFPIPDAMDDGLAAMMEPFAVALHANRRAGRVAGQRVLVTGGGPIGLLVALVARTFGTAVVALSDPVENRRRLAKEIGVDHVLDPADSGFKGQVSKITEDGFDLLFEASGASPAVQQGFEVVRRGGTIVQIGVMSVPEVSLPVNQLMIRELQFVGSFRYGDVFEEGIRLISAQRLDLTPLISRVFPFGQAPEAMLAACDHEHAMKIQLSMLST